MGCCPVATALPNDDNLNDKSQPLDSPGDRHQANRLHADRLKEQGNVMFKQGKYQEAFVLYGKAIVLLAISLGEISTGTYVLHESGDVHASIGSLERSLAEHRQRIAAEPFPL